MHHVVVGCSLQAMQMSWMMMTMTLAMTLAGGSKCDNRLMPLAGQRQEE